MGLLSWLLQIVQGSKPDHSRSGDNSKTISDTDSNGDTRTDSNPDNGPESPSNRNTGSPPATSQQNPSTANENQTENAPLHPARDETTGSSSQSTDRSRSQEERTEDASESASVQHVQTGDTEIDRWLTDLLSDHQSVRRTAWHALLLLANEHPERFLPHLSPLGSSLEETSATGMDAITGVFGILASVAPKEVGPYATVLVNHIDHPSASVRDNITAALTQLPPSSIPVPPLLSALSSPEPHGNAATIVLARIAAKAPDRIDTGQLNELVDRQSQPAATRAMYLLFILNPNDSDRTFDLNEILAHQPEEALPEWIIDTFTEELAKDYVSKHTRNSNVGDATLSRTSMSTSLELAVETPEHVDIEELANYLETQFCLQDITISLTEIPEADSSSATTEPTDAPIREDNIDTAPESQSPHAPMISPGEFAELSGFKRDLLVVIAGLDAPKGLQVKEELEKYYDETINHGRLYPNLDSLVDKGFIEKRALDERSNAYVLTTLGQDHLRAHHARLVDRIREREPSTESDNSKAPAETPSDSSTPTTQQSVEQEDNPEHTQNDTSHSHNNTQETENQRDILDAIESELDDLASEGSEE